MRKRKQALSFILVLLIIFSFSANIYAETEIRGNFKYKKGTNIIYEYVGSDPNLVFPEDVELSNSFRLGDRSKEPVVKTITIGKNLKYGEDSFRNMNDERDKLIAAVKEVTFEEGIEEIPSKMFMDYMGIEKINFPTTLKKIGDQAFSWSDGTPHMNIRDLYIPDSVTEIGEGAFDGCGKLGDVHMPKSLRILNGFKYAHAKSVNIPDAYAKLCYDENSGMLKASFNLQADEYKTDNGMTGYIYRLICNREWTKEKYNKGLTDEYMGENKDFIILDDILCRYIGKDKIPVVPDSVKAIVPYAFAGAEIYSVKLNNKIKYIPAYCFTDSTIEEIEIPPNIETIYKCSFSLAKIRKLFIPKTVKQFSNLGLLPVLEELTIEGNPKVESMMIVSGTLLTKDTLHILDPNFVFDEEEFWENQNTDGKWYPRTSWATPRPENTQKPTATPKATAVPTVKPTATATAAPDATPNPSALPNETEKPAEQETDSISVAVNEGEINITSDKGKVHFPDAKPFVDESERTQIPIRALAEMLDFNVEWNGNELKAVLTKNDITIIIQIGSREIQKNGQKISMDTTAKVINDRTYIPLRYIAEALGYEVLWKK